MMQAISTDSLHSTNERMTFFFAILSEFRSRIWKNDDYLQSGFHAVVLNIKESLNGNVVEKSSEQRPFYYTRTPYFLYGAKDYNFLRTTV